MKDCPGKKKNRQLFWEKYENTIQTKEIDKIYSIAHKSIQTINIL